MAGWYGIERSNHDFDEAKSWGKNIFTNAAPVSIAQFLSLAMHEKPVVIEVVESPSGSLMTVQTLRDWASVIATDPALCRFDFESPYLPYAQFTKSGRMPDNSDVVVSDTNSIARRAFEIKLTAVPDSASKNAPHDQQSAEIVARPATIEQLALSVCESYEAAGGRHALNDLVVAHIPSPQAFDWSSVNSIQRAMPQVISFLESVIRAGLSSQIPTVLNVIWRTKGARPVLEEAAFDVFVWTNFAFLRMFVDSATSSIGSGKITRPQRSLVWLAKMLYDYSVQGFFSREDTTRTITLGLQNDKAASFSGPSTIRYLKGPQLSSPRISVETFDQLMLGNSLEFLAPERRLDAVIYMNHLVRTGDAPPSADLTSDPDGQEPV